MIENPTPAPRGSTEMIYQDAIAKQAENLRLSLSVVEEALSSTDLSRWRGGTIGFTGMGASANALCATTGQLSPRGQRAVNVPPEELLLMARSALIDSVVAVSQGGTSLETLAAAKSASDLPRLVITDAVDSPLANLGEAVVPLGLLEDSVVYVLGYTATIQALGQLSAALLAEELDSGWTELPSSLERILADAPEAIDRLAERLGEPRAIDLVGSGSHLASAREGALVLREAARLPTACFRAREYLHGPMEALEKGVLAVVIGDGREVALARDVSRFGVETLLLTTTSVSPMPNLTVIKLPALEPEQLAVLEIVPIQLLSAVLASRRGLLVDGFRYEQSDTKATSSTITGPTLAPRLDTRMGSIGIDVGGTKLAVVLTSGGDDSRLEFHDVARTPTGSPDTVLAVAAELVEKALLTARREQIEIMGVGVVVPELVDLNGEIASHDVIPGLKTRDWVARFDHVAPVTVDSDVRAAATAEAAIGAGRSTSSFCYVTVGTGISYCLVDNGVVRTGARGGAILLGSSVLAEWENESQVHQWVLEQLASGPALLGRYVELGGSRATSAEVIAAYGEEPAATRAVKDAAGALGIGLALLVNLLDPEALVVGGGLGGAEGAFWRLAVESAREHIWSDGARELPLVQAALGSRSAAVGAAILGRRHRAHERQNMGHLLQHTEPWATAK
jgi:glucosamine--fructose-6-phosphate aminotransferase (isomerizing)